MSSLIEELQRRRMAGEHVKALEIARGILLEPDSLSLADMAVVAREGFLAASSLLEYHEAARLAEVSLRSARAAAEPALIAAATYHVASAMINNGDWAQAREQLEAFLAMSIHTATVHYQAPAWFNLGLVLLGQRRYREAVDRFRQAEAAYAGDGANIARCLLEAAWAELMDGRPEPAGLYLQRATDQLGESPDPDVQTTLLCHRAFYHYQLREHTTAAELCREVTVAGRPGVTSHHKSEAAWIAGECALALGKTEWARELAAVAVAEATIAVRPWLMNRAADLQRRVADAESA